MKQIAVTPVSFPVDVRLPPAPSLAPQPGAVSGPRASPTGRPAVFWDRDGVLNHALVVNEQPLPPRSVGELRLMPGARRVLAATRRAGFLNIVVTNQPDVARGTLERAAVESIHARLRAALPIDHIEVCYHDDGDGCACRKPQPGMLLAAAAACGVDLRASVMVGDRWRDVEAGSRAGCATVFIDHPYAEPLRSIPDVRVPSLAAAGAWVLARHLTKERAS